MKDVTELLHNLSSNTTKLEHFKGFLFFVAPKIDFRQSQVPEFLHEGVGGPGDDCDDS